MSGSVYPCHKCGESNWVTDIADNGLCPKCNVNDPCLDCTTSTLGVMTMADGSTVGIGINRLFVDWGDRSGYLCGECAGYECDGCGKNIYLDEDITIETESNGNEKYHYDCLTPELRALAIKQGELND